MSSTRPSHSTPLSRPAPKQPREIEATFTNPLNAEKKDRAILKQAIELIKGTPKGAEIRAAIHSLADNKVQRALEAAHKRGVKVIIVQDGKNLTGKDSSGRDLAAALKKRPRLEDGTLGEKGVNVWGDKGAITKHPSGIMHTKLMLFSKTEVDGVMRENVSWFGSANFTPKTGAKTFNNTITVYDDKKLYKDFKDYFRDLRNRKDVEGNDYFDGGRGFGQSGNVKFYASPDTNHDPVAAILNDIKPEGAEIRVDQAMIFKSRGNLVQKLAQLKKDGAKVLVVAHKIHDEMRRILREAKIPLRINKTHDKTIAINADLKSDAGNDKVKMVVTGSHNWTKSANKLNDEVLVTIRGEEIYNQYKNHFQTVFETGHKVGQKKAHG
jgi:phosphatidylserine/phosphatidylglycerophosphate/cardiolipin synthase-like enzyme